jgi:protocatechuate 3,4-dioxygenase, alpha subunit
MPRLQPTGSQTIGPFFFPALIADGQAELVRPETDGERITFAGRILDGQGEPVTDAMVEIWQANAAGRYDHPEDRQDKPLDPAFHGFGRGATDRNGRFSFDTVLPGPVPGRGNALQAPHIAITIFARGLLRHLVTRAYFAGNPLNETDPVLSSIADEAARRTLIAQPREDGGKRTYEMEIRLQGDGETVFFDV